MKRYRSIRIILIASMFEVVFAACTHFPVANNTVAVPAAAKGRDVFDIAIDAARSVDLPPATKIDKANGVVEFGSFGMPVLAYSAQVRKRSDGQLDVTVKRGSAYISRDVDEKAKEFVAALQARLQ